jgi:hypothetical protein
VRDPVERKRLVLAVPVTKTSACHENQIPAALETGQPVMVEKRCCEFIQ